MKKIWSPVLPMLLVSLALLVSFGCMYMPYHNQKYSSRDATISFNGYVDSPDAPVQIFVKAWSERHPTIEECAYQGGAHWQFLGQTYSTSSPTYDNTDKPWYYWNFQTVIPQDNWCLAAGPELGAVSYATEVTGIYRVYHSPLGTKWMSLLTVEDDFFECAQHHDFSGLSILGNCTRTGEDAHRVTIWAAQ